MHQGPEHQQQHDVGFVVGNFLREAEELDAIQQPEQDPVMRRVDEQSFQGHGLAAEDMDEDSFEFPFDIVRDCHDGCEGLPERILLPLAKIVKQRDDDDGSEILQVEHVLPFDLLPYPLYIDSGFVLEVGRPDGQFVVIKDDFLAVFVDEKYHLFRDRNSGCLRK